MEREVSQKKKITFKIDPLTEPFPLLRLPELLPYQPSAPSLTLVFGEYNTVQRRNYMET